MSHRILPSISLALAATLALGWRAVAQTAPQASTQAAPESLSSTIEGPRLAKVEFRDLPLFEACRLLSEQTGLNLVPSEGARAQNVSLYLRDVESGAAVEGLCRAHQLWFQYSEQTKLLRIHTVDEYKRNLVDYQKEKTEYFTLLYPNALDVGYAIRNLFGNRVVLRTDDTESEILFDLASRFSRFDLVESRVEGLGSSTNGQYGGQGYGSYDQNYGGYGAGYGLGTIGQGRGGMLGDYGQEAETEREREREQQAKPLDLDADEITQLERAMSQYAAGSPARVAIAEALARHGKAPIRVSIARRQNKLVVRTGDEAALTDIRELVQKLDNPTALVLLEVRVLAVDLLDGMSSFFDYQFADDKIAGAFTTGDILQPTPPALGPAGTGLNSDDLVFQYVDSHFAVRLQALERDNRVRALSTPVLLTANNEVSRLFVGREVPLNRSFTGGQVVTNESTTTTATGSTQIEFRPVGTTLLITPNINADRTVTLRVVQETSNTDTQAAVLVPDEEGFTQQVVSVVSSQSVAGTIVAKSELAVVFGGLIEEAVTKQKDQVPILGDIPLIGLLFQRNVDAKTRREIVIVVRPYVLSTPQESEAVSGRLLGALGSDAETLGVPTDKPADASGKPRPRFHFHGLDPAGDEK